MYVVVPCPCFAISVSCPDPGPRLLKNKDARAMWMQYCKDACVPFNTFALAVRKYLEEDLATDSSKVASLFADDFEVCLQATVDTNRDKWVSTCTHLAAGPELAASRCRAHKL